MPVFLWKWPVFLYPWLPFGGYRMKFNKNGHCWEAKTYWQDQSVKQFGVNYNG